MAGNYYHFVTHWVFEASIEEISDILADVETLKTWWPSVYLEVKVLAPGDENDIGKQVKLYTKGWLPYTLQWEFEVTHNRRPRGFTIQAKGDLVGRGNWSLRQQGKLAFVTFDWKVSAEKPFLKRFSYLFRPFFAANHRWAMQKGEESLRLELQRRRSDNPSERQLISGPPQPTFKWAIRNIQ